MTRLIPNLGAALWIVAKAEAAEHFMHADVDAWGAPGECHHDVSRGEEQRMLAACAKAEAITGAPWSEIIEQAKARGVELAGPKWDEIVGRAYQAADYPF